eukprot:5963086-Pyramimonas_sp.AAC.1
MEKARCSNLISKLRYDKLNGTCMAWGDLVSNGFRFIHSSRHCAWVVGHRPPRMFVGMSSEVSWGPLGIRVEASWGPFW